MRKTGFQRRPASSLLLSHYGERQYDSARRDAEILPAFELERDRRCGDRGASLKVPDGISTTRVEGNQIAGGVAVEHQVARGRQHAAAGTGLQFAPPLH